MHRGGRTERRATDGMRGRSVGAEPMTGGVMRVVDARGLAEERGLGDGLHILHGLYLNLRLGAW